MTNDTPALDPQKRLELKNEILNLLRRTYRGIDRGLQLEGVSLDNPTPENFALVLVIQDILRETREFSVVQWPGGIALVKTAQVDSIDKAYQDINENANFIVRGQSDKAEDFTEHLPTPVGPPKWEE